ncbi:MAG: flippase-like domain-containing protein [Cytophagales bacterium]|nr:flippase-like domain-containing protein [Cytophaga sp.]
MQVNEPFVKKIKYIRFFSLFLKVFIFVISVYIILSMLSGKKEWYEEIYQAYATRSGVLLCIVMFGMMMMNIGLEAWKWKRLVHSIEPIPFASSLMAVFSGIYAGLLTPHSIGDYVGRILFVQNGKRLESIGSVLFSRLSQLLITCMTGIAAACYFLWNIEMDQRVFILLILSIITIVLFYIGWHYKTMLLDKMKSIPVLNKIEFWFEHIRTYSTTLFYETLALSGLRYTIFLTQFVCLLVFFEIDLPVTILVIGVIFTFFVKSVVPTLLDLGVRELAAVIFFSQFGIAQEPVILASLSLWFFNLILPSCIGLFCMFKIER